MPPVEASVGPVKGRSAIEEILSPPAAPKAACPESQNNRELRDCAVKDSSIHNLAEAGFLPLQKRGQDTEDKKTAAAAHIANEVERRDRATIGRTNGFERARQRQISEIV